MIQIVNDVHVVLVERIICLMVLQSRRLERHTQEHCPGTTSRSNLPLQNVLLVN
jgi:hypothetical protein